MSKALGSISTLVIVVVLGGCSSSRTEVVNSCSSDAECPSAGFRCDLTQARCVCSSDEACGEGEFCNGAGACQTLAGCLRNSECPKDSFCDIASGACLAEPSKQLSSQCGLASHCPQGTICVEGSCSVGCFDDGDCVLGQVCLGGVCATGDGLCSGDDFCEYKERCVNDKCTKDRRGPYCRGCTFRTVQNPTPCDAPRNFCLVNSLELGGFPQFCGVDCSLGQPCPNGYDCNGVVILTDNPCISGAECKCDAIALPLTTSTCTVAAACEPDNPRASGCTVAKHPDCAVASGEDALACFVRRNERVGRCACETDAHCQNGSRCVDGICCGGDIREELECYIGESRPFGFCSCATDDDCPRDVCDGTEGACAISGLPCTPGNNDCGPIPCVDGGCLIGQNCAPIQGLSCSVVGGSP